MKSLYTFIALAMITFGASAQQVYTVSGPRSFFNIPANSGSFTFFNLETGKEVPASDSATSNWHVAFNKTKMIFNSGNAGPGAVTGQLLNSDFMKTTTLPTEGYAAENTSGLIVPTGSGNGWYTYNPNNNVISANYDRSIALKWGNTYALLQVVDYYQNQDITKASGVYSIRVQLSSTTDVSQKYTRVNNLYAGYPTKQLFNLASADSIAPADSLTNKWHMAFMTTTIYTNSGSSGPGTHEIQIVSQNFNDVKLAPETGYKQDQEGATAITTGSGNGWYTYDIVVHSITPTANRTILGKDGLGHYSKLAVKSYYKDAPANPTFLDMATTKYYTMEYFFNPMLSRNLDLGSTTTDISDLQYETENNILIYPNPAVNQDVVVSFTRAGQQFSLIDMNGRVVTAGTADINGKAIIQTEGLNKGIYLVQAANTSRKLVIQ